MPPFLLWLYGEEDVCTVERGIYLGPKGKRLFILPDFQRE
jgi:hypothetical protein